MLFGSGSSDEIGLRAGERVLDKARAAYIRGRRGFTLSRGHIVLTDQRLLYSEDMPRWLAWLMGGAVDSFKIERSNIQSAEAHGGTRRLLGGYVGAAELLVTSRDGGIARFQMPHAEHWAASLSSSE